LLSKLFIRLLASNILVSFTNYHKKIILKSNKLPIRELLARGVSTSYVTDLAFFFFSCPNFLIGIKLAIRIMQKCPMVADGIH